MPGLVDLSRTDYARSLPSPRERLMRTPAASSIDPFIGASGLRTVTVTLPNELEARQNFRRDRLSHSLDELPRLLLNDAPHQLIDRAVRDGVVKMVALPSPAQIDRQARRQPVKRWPSARSSGLTP